MNNFDIALDWVRKQTVLSTKPILSNQFFQPFTKSQAVALRRKLIKTHYLFPLDESLRGALIVAKNNPHITIVRRDGQVAGAYCKDGQMVTFPMMMFADTVGVM